MGTSDAAVETQPVRNEPSQPKVTSGWRFTLVTGAAASLVVFILNLSVTLWAIKLPTGITREDVTGRRIIFEGHAILIYDAQAEPRPYGMDAWTLIESERLGRGGCRTSPSDWICGEKHDCGGCRDLLPSVRSQADDWKPFGSRVQYCLSKPVRQVCRVNFSIFVASGIMVANIIKVVILAYVALCPPKEPLLVPGDAIQTFLTTPEQHSRGMCLVSMKCMKAQGIQGCIAPSTAPQSQRRWAAAASTRRWAATCLFYSIALGGSLFLLFRGITNLIGPRDFKSIWNLGFGTTSDAALIYGVYESSDIPSTDLENVINVLLANSTHLIFSILYFQYNGLFTCMLLAREWPEFGRKRRALRVSSSPKGEQRSRYSLQLPYRFGIPLLIISILMHWMLSQSIFVVVIEQMAERSPYVKPSPLKSLLATCGYSPVAMVFFIIGSNFMVIWVVVTACQRLPTAIPLVGSCSLAIAAACHHPDGIPQPDAPLVPLKWGVMNSSEPVAGTGYRQLWIF
ncbi:hypothetical protein ACJZ2D_010311 [Fusarium nematophilum]